MRVWMEEEKKPKISFGKLFMRIFSVAMIAFLVLFYMLFRDVTNRKYVVVGVSMMPSFQEGDELFFQVEDEYAYGDIIIFYSDYGLLVKRVVGLPGDRIAINDDGSIIRNGAAVEERYIAPDALKQSACPEIVVEQGRLFVLGDNRGNSVDSRDSRIGQVLKSMVCGKVTEVKRIFD